MSTLTKEQIINEKKRRNAIILAHYYVDKDVQDIADFVGDSYYLSKVAATTDADTIVFCGVSFMGESAKLLNPDKTVLMPDSEADCPMAHMCDVSYIKEIKKQYSDLAVVCYINSTTTLKSYADVCVTSSNALKIVKQLPNKNILFIPDENLGHYIAKLVPEKNFIFNKGFCPVHKAITKQDLIDAKSRHKDALVLSHPECTEDILALSDFVGSTSEIIEYAHKDPCKEFIIATETGVFASLQKNQPDKKFYPVNDHQICVNMKKVTLDKVLDVLQNNHNEVTLSKEISASANTSLNKMLEYATTKANNSSDTLPDHLYDRLYREEGSHGIN